MQQTSDRRLRRQAALEHGEETRSVSQTRLESNHAVTCQAFIRSDDLASYGFPLKVADEVPAARLVRNFTYTIIDTGQRPKQVDLKALAEGCDLLVIPAVPVSLDTDGLVLTLQALGEVRYRVLLTKVPPHPEPEGPQLRADLAAQGIPLFAVDIPRLKAFRPRAS